MEKNPAMADRELSTEATHNQAPADLNQEVKQEPTSALASFLSFYAFASLAVAAVAGGVLWPSSYLPFSEKTDALVLVFSVWGAGIAHAMFFIALARILDYLKIIANKLA